MQNSLRGYPLRGRSTSVPSGHKGIVFKETQKPLSDTVERTFKVDKIFDRFTYWNYDLNPSENDALHKALDWIQVAKAVS